MELRGISKITPEGHGCSHINFIQEIFWLSSFLDRHPLMTNSFDKVQDDKFDGLIKNFSAMSQHTIIGL